METQDSTHTDRPDDAPLDEAHPGERIITEHFKRITKQQKRYLRLTIGMYVLAVVLVATWFYIGLLRTNNDIESAREDIESAREDIKSVRTLIGNTQETITNAQRAIDSISHTDVYKLQQQADSLDSLTRTLDGRTHTLDRLLRTMQETLSARNNTLAADISIQKDSLANLRSSMVESERSRRNLTARLEAINDSLRTLKTSIQQAGLSNIQLIFGVVDLNEEEKIQEGEGYTVTRIEEGKYVLRFKVPFSEPPALFAMLHINNSYWTSSRHTSWDLKRAAEIQDRLPSTAWNGVESYRIFGARKSREEITIVIIDDDETKDKDLDDAAWSFVAVGFRNRQ